MDPGKPAEGTEHANGDTDSVSTFRTNQKPLQKSAQSETEAQTDQDKSTSSSVTVESRVSVMERTTKSLQDATIKNSEQLTRIEKQLTDFMQMMMTTQTAATGNPQGGNKS